MTTKKHPIERNHKRDSSQVRPKLRWKRRMSTSMQDLMSDDVDRSEEQHMSLHSNAKFERIADQSFPCASRRASVPLPFTLNEDCFQHDDADGFLAKRSCYPRFRQFSILDKQDLEVRLEAFRKSLTLVDFSEEDFFDESGTIQYNC